MFFPHLAWGKSAPKCIGKFVILFEVGVGPLLEPQLLHHSQALTFETREGHLCQGIIFLINKLMADFKKLFRTEKPAQNCIPRVSAAAAG